MTVPERFPREEAVAFARERRSWILEAKARSRPSETVSEGLLLPVEGKPRRLVLNDVRSPVLEEETLLLPRRNPGTAAAAFLKLRARDRLASACDLHAGRIGARYTSLVIRDTRSRWGSCSHAGRLMFSWRLIMAPPSILDYVAAHEVAHRRHMDHSSAFWALVETMVPDWRAKRAWLREHGNGLHAFRFEN